MKALAISPHSNQNYIALNIQNQPCCFSFPSRSKSILNMFKVCRFKKPTLSILKYRKRWLFCCLGRHGLVRSTWLFRTEALKGQPTLLFIVTHHASQGLIQTNHNLNFSSTYTNMHFWVLKGYHAGDLSVITTSE